MEEILLTENYWFDEYGNLCVGGGYHGREMDGMLAPLYFKLLGKLRKIKVDDDGHRYPRWMIESEYEDIFTPNMALRFIATGNLDKEEMVDVAKQAVVIP